jgi:hypothetical protein
LGKRQAIAGETNSQINRKTEASLAAAFNSLSLRRSHGRAQFKIRETRSDWDSQKIAVLWISLDSPLASMDIER